MSLTVAEPCDNASSATLLSDTSSGRALGSWRRGSGGCRRNERFRTADLSSMGSPGRQVGLLRASVQRLTAMPTRVSGRRPRTAKAK
jgi:hypothetical protein